jgi:CRISPR-associated Csx11 family protein
MSGLNLEGLKNHRDEVLKAEIGALLFNLGKTHIGFSFWKSYFPNSNYKWSSYKKYVNNFFDMELTQVDKQLEDFINAIQINLTFITNLKMKEIMQGRESSSDFVQKIFFRGCENINSGIDKGSPKEQLKNKLWISNAFGSFKKNVELQDFDDERICFYNKFHNFLSCHNYYIEPSWQEIRKFVFTEIKNWYSRLLSDSRFPVNDVTLWDQAYMTATMFKAVLAQLFMDSSKVQNYMDNPSSIRWRILGIQYDKLALAEKGYKPQQIQWYRNTSREIDNEIKKLLEYDYPIGNEIYRDETGIYFLVGEGLGDDSSGKLHTDLKSIKEKIIKIFKDKSFDEFYPAIFLTKASRGIMNLAYLLENAKENFLKADWSKKETNICLVKSESGRAKGICQVCRQRLVFESNRLDEDKNICDICYEEKTKGRIDKWLEDTSKETIWMDELKDKNDRVALVTMKFELYDWLNGDMLNSILVNEKSYTYAIDLMVKTLKVIKVLFNEKAFLVDSYKNKNSDLNENFLLKIENIIDPVSDSTLLRKYKGLELKMEKSNLKLVDKKNNEQQLKTLLNNEPFKNFIQIFDFKIFNLLAKDAYGGCKGNNESFHDFIKQIFFGSIIGTHWEEWIKKSGLNSKIDWENETIDWQELDDSDIDFLSTLILQFLLGKNPSPARLRRIWESTQEFFEDIKKDICATYAGIPEERRRYYWEKSVEDGEYYDGEAVFWANKGKVYSISYIKDLPKNKEFKLKKYEDKKDTEIMLDLSAAKTESYQPYMSIIDPTPISWQFIIPAEYVPNLVDNVMKKYNENFKFVYGKLPLHIGVVIQDYKKPLYVGVKALRKIRRDIQDVGKLEVPVVASKVKEKLKCQKIEESLNDTYSYYSLYKRKDNGDYQFYIKPNDEDKHWILNIDKFNDDKKVTIVSNTFDFEFLDTNTRRNDIYYDDNNKYKRKINFKSGRPYDLDTWKKFEKFKELFSKDNISGSIRSTKLQNLISVIYDKWEYLVSDSNQIKNDTEGIEAFLASSFVNIFKLNSDENLADGIRDLFDVDKSEKDVKIYDQLKRKMTLDNVQLFLDMFEFWHKTLKEV